MKKLFAALLALVSSVALATTTVPVQLLNPAGSTSGQVILSTGPSSAPAWGGISLSGLGAIAANTVVANATSSSSVPSAFSMPSCSSSTSALQYTSGAGFTCNAGMAPLASPSFTGVETITNSATSGNTLVINASSNTSSGAQIFLGGNGGTNPNKYVRAFNGTFQIVNSANSAIPMSMDDSGNVTYTGTMTSTGIVGVTNASNATSGNVGQVISSTQTSTGISTTTPTNLTSISLTAGDWDVQGFVNFNAAGSTATTQVLAGINTTSATLPASTNYSQFIGTFPTGANVPVPVPYTRINVSSTTTVYLVVEAIFNTSTMTAQGFLSARRMR